MNDNPTAWVSPHSEGSSVLTFELQVAKIKPPYTPTELHEV